MNSKKNHKQNINKQNDSSLFQFVKPNDNDELSKMTGLDLQEFIWYLDHYYLELRTKLGFDDKVTFGLELEFEQAMNMRISKRMKNDLLLKNWCLKGDSSLDKGGEITSPVLRDNQDSWEHLTNVCTIVKDNAQIGDNCGGHIHVGVQVIGDERESWLNFIKLWSVYENIIYRFTYGEFLVARTSMNSYARPLSKRFWEDYITSVKKPWTTNEIIDQANHERYQAVNFENIFNLTKYSYKNTVEFRCPNGSLDPIIWQNNVNFFVNILKYSKSRTYDDDVVMKRHKANKDKYVSLSDYNEIYLEQALELCDMIFDNNFDKVYFLRQYLKTFQIGTEELEKATRFTRVIK